MTDAVVRALLAARAEQAARRQLRRQLLDAEINSAREQGFATGGDPCAELYDPTMGLPA